MKPSINDIVQKMKDTSYSELNFEFAYKLTNESERGAILIGSSKVEEYLEKLILTILPKDSKTYRNRLMKYPGPASSFSGKIELLYAFRIINEDLYNSLNQLRTIRNQAAHSSENFFIEKYNEDLPKIYSFEEHSKELVEFLARNNLIKWKRSTIKKILDKQKLDRKTYREIWKEKTSELAKHPSIQKQLVIWKLSYGLVFVCLKISVLNDEFSKLDKSKTWLG